MHKPITLPLAYLIASVHANDVLHNNLRHYGHSELITTFISHTLSALSYYTIGIAMYCKSWPGNFVLRLKIWPSKRLSKITSLFG